MKVSPHIEQLRARWRRTPPVPTSTHDVPILPPIHEDLGGLTKLEIELEAEVIRRRIEKGIIKPEGINGLNYRLTRLQAQMQALEKKS